MLAGVDGRAGQIGTVRATYADAGDMVHVLDFDDGTTATSPKSCKRSTLHRR